MKKLSLPKFLVLSLFAFTFSFTNISCIGYEPWTNTTCTNTTSTEEETGLSAPTNVTVKASSERNYVTVKWDNGYDYYWIYYNSTNDSSTATLATRNGSSLGENIKLSESGTYYFWVKAADGTTSSSATSDFSKVATYTFTYSELPAPTNVTVKASSEINYVTVKWENSSGAYCYWVYYNSTNDSSTATCAKTNAYYGTFGTDIKLSESGTYYFWVKAADDNTSSSDTSDFSEVATYTFTYLELTAPTNVTVKASSTTNYVKVKWEECGAKSYKIYYNSTNDSSTATLATIYGSLDGTYGTNIKLSESGTYYIWVKAFYSTTSSSGYSDFSEVATYTFTKS